MRAGASRSPGAAETGEVSNALDDAVILDPHLVNDGMRPSTGSMRGIASPTAGRQVVMSSG